MKIITAMPGMPVEIGRTGENHAIKVLFQNILPGWKETYGEGLVSMIYKRPKDKHAYPVVCLIENDGADISWIVSRTDLENSGLGKLELIYTVDDTVAISETYPIIVKRSISGEAGSEPPEDPGKTWFENMNDKVTSLEKREMIVIFTVDKNLKIHADHSYEEIREACLNQNTLVTGLFGRNNLYINLPIVSYQKSENQIVFTGARINTASVTDTDGWYWLKIVPDETVAFSVKFYEMSFNKDSSRISDPNSKNHYPSTKVMVDYVNSQILAGKEIFVVNWTQSPEVCQADKTYAEIKAALENDVVTVVGKTKNDGTTYATHEITIATDGKIYFRFIWYDETHGTMEKYFWLQEDEYGSAIPPHPVSQQDWAENNEASASYVKNRPGGYDISKTIEMSAEFSPNSVEVNRWGYAGFIFAIFRVSDDITGLQNAIEKKTFSLVPHSEKDLEKYKDISNWVITTDYAYLDTKKVGGYPTEENKHKIPSILLIFNESRPFDFLSVMSPGVYISASNGSGVFTSDSSDVKSISWTYIETEPVKIPLKYIEADHSLGIISAQVEQIAKITAVDDTGKPTAWGPVDMPSGDSLGAVLHTPQDLTDEQKRQARENIEALSNNSVYYTYLPDNHNNDIYKLAISGPIGFITGNGAAGMIPPITVIFGAMDRGIVNTFAIDFHGYMYHTSLSLASGSEPVWTKIEQLRLNNNGTLPQQTMASSPTENMQIATKKYVDDHLRMPSGGGETWETINVITLSDAVNTVAINQDSGGNAIALKKVRILVEGSATNNQDLFLNNSRYIRANVVGSAASVGALSAEPFCGKMYCFAVTNISANYASISQLANIFSEEITITEIKLIVNNSGTFSAGTKFTIQGVRA